ncbi:MAG: hypothetical protein HYZ53_24700 [Planctomycetes bacterium]|nr:hypothetical protein [Planctomycetota bacterium]
MPTPWKQLERDTAEALGGRRNVRADFGDPGPDVLLPPGSPFGGVECKVRKALPKLLREGLDQAKRGASNGQPPLLVIRQRGSPNVLAVLRLSNLVELLRLGGGRPDRGLTPDLASGIIPVPDPAPNVPFA